MPPRISVDPLIHKGYLGELADAYLPGGLDRKDPRVSPLYADLRGFPPTLIQVGSDETLLADATRFAAAAGAADVAVTLEIWPHMIYAWPLWNAHLEPAAARSRGSAHLSALIFDAAMMAKRQTGRDFALVSAAAARRLGCFGLGQMA